MKIEELKTGDILLYRSKGVLPWLIRLFTNSHVNHAAICVEIWGEMFVAESESKGFVLNKIGDSVRGSEIWVMRYIKPIDYKSFAVRIASMLGKHRYDFASLLFFQVWYSLTGEWVGKNDKHASKRLYCSEAIAYIYSRELFEMLEWWKYNPKMVWEEKNFMRFRLYVDR